MSPRSPRRPRRALVVKRGIAGLGLFTEEPIERGIFVVEYFGPLLTDDEANAKGGKYLFEIPDSVWTIDGTSRDNLARYINHSCKPNCEAVGDGNRILIYTKRKIKAGEELSYDYGKQYTDDMECHCGHH